MIKINPNKTKDISFRIDVEGIDPQLLEYNLRISNGKIDYGFKGELKNGEISFSIPPLKEVVTQDNIDSLNVMMLEVHDRNNKYYLKPFEDTLNIDKSLKVEATLSEEKEKEDSEFKVKASMTEEKDKEKKPKEEKKSTKFGKFLVKE